MTDPVRCEARPSDRASNRITDEERRGAIGAADGDVWVGNTGANNRGLALVQTDDLLLLAVCRWRSA